MGGGLIFSNTHTCSLASNPAVHDAFNDLDDLSRLRYVTAKFHRYYISASAIQENQHDDDLLHNKNYDGRKIVVCWNHTSIPQLANALGVKPVLPKWPSEDFDSVFVLTFNDSGLNHFTELHNQYPVSFDGSWQNIENAIKKIK
jgi:hypothetical protein